MSTQTADVAVIGLGAMGAAALYQLASRGVRAIGIDRFDPPHDRGSSHGETRITRQAVGEGDGYAPLVLRSHAIWRDLESMTGKRLLTACGALVIGPTASASSHHGQADFLQATVAVARRHTIAHEVLDRAELSHRFPLFTGLGSDDAGYYEPGGGYVDPGACIAAQLDRAAVLGARVVGNTQVGAIRQHGSVVRIATPQGDIEAEHAIVAAGAWTAPLLGRPFDGILRVTRQVLHWFEPDDPRPFGADRLPVFIRMHGARDSDYFYGFPIPPGTAGVKVATEQYEHETTADTIDRAVSPSEAEQMHAEHLAGRLAWVGNRALRSVACLYTNTPDAGFIVDAHPRMERVHVVSACSGHGFKHSAAIGEAVAERIVTGRTTLDLSNFRLERYLGACGESASLSP